MKYFVVFALCVAAASAATVRAGVGVSGVRPWQTASARASVVPVAPKVPVVPVAPVAPVAPVEAVVTKPVDVAARSYVKSSVTTDEASAPVLRSESDVTAQGFSFNYETGNGIAAEATGELKKVDNTEAVVQKGSYRYTSVDGSPVIVTYIADENGYQPQGDHLPVPPPIPAAILRSLEYIAAHPQKEEVVKRV